MLIQNVDTVILHHIADLFTLVLFLSVLAYFHYFEKIK
jgi:hypothetical protein